LGKKVMIWKREISLEKANQFSKDTLVDCFDINIIEIGNDFIKASMPVDRRTVQPYRVLHGGASAALAESLGSIAASFCMEDPINYMPVGVEINASHLRPAFEGSTVYGITRPVRIGRNLQVWEIKIEDESGKLVCVSRLTIAIIERRR